MAFALPACSRNAICAGNRCNVQGAEHVRALTIWIGHDNSGADHCGHFGMLDDENVAVAQANLKRDEWHCP